MPGAAPPFSSSRLPLPATTLFFLFHLLNTADLQAWNGEALQLADMALRPECRGCGIGGGLIGDLQEEAARGGLAVRLNSFAATPAWQLYSALGVCHRQRQRRTV